MRRAAADYHFPTDTIRLWLGDVSNEQIYAATPITWEAVPAGATADDPTLTLDVELAHAIHDALGRALGLTPYDPKLTLDTLRLEQTRVDRLLEWITTRPGVRPGAGF